MCSFFEDFTMIHKYYFITSSNRRQSMRNKNNRFFLQIFKYGIINLPLLTALKYHIKWEKFILEICWNPMQSVPFRNKLETRCKRRRPL